MTATQVRKPGSRQSASSSSGKRPMVGRYGMRKPLRKRKAYSMPRKDSQGFY